MDQEQDSRKKVVVSGDVHYEWRFAESAIRNQIDNDGLYDPYNYMEVYFKPVGAMSVGAIINRSLIGLPSIWPGVPKPEAVILDRASFMGRESINYLNPYWHAYVICAQYPKKDGKEVVWRVKQKFGIDRKKKIANLNEFVLNKDEGDASLVVIEHSNQGFIGRENIWPKSLRQPQKTEDEQKNPWLLLEWTRPVFEDVKDGGDQGESNGEFNLSAQQFAQYSSWRAIRQCLSWSLV